MLNLEIMRDGELQHCVSALAIQSLFLEEIQSSHDKDPKLVKLKEQSREEKAGGFFFMRMED